MPFIVSESAGGVGGGTVKYLVHCVGQFEDPSAGGLHYLP